VARQHFGEGLDEARRVTGITHDDPPKNTSFRALTARAHDVHFAQLENHARRRENNALRPKKDRTLRHS
jgi:hypothetical protein